MSNFIVNKKSFHYRLNSFLKRTLLGQNLWNFESKLPTDFCSYWRMVVINSIISLITISLISLILIALIMKIVEEPIGFIIGFGGVVGVVALIIGWVYMFHWIKDTIRASNDRKRRENIPDGIIKTKYKSWKQKYCPSIEYKD